MDNINAYTKLKTLFAEVSILKSIDASLTWDMEVIMPKGSIEARGEQLGLLAGMIANKLRDPSVAELLEKAATEDLGQWDAANLRMMRHIHAHSTAVPVALLVDYAESSSRCCNVWKTARENNDWNMLLPHLENLVDLARQIAKVKSTHLGLSLYDALLDEHDPGRRFQEVDKHFSYLATEIPELIAEIMKRQGALQPWPQQVPIEQQKQLGIEYMQDLGFDFATGRLDTSTHPFCIGDYPDVRITSRYNVDDPMMSLYGILHETGHAMYQQQLPREWRKQPVGSAHGMSIHESQSLFVEMQMCRHPEFIKGLHSRIKMAFGEDKRIDTKWLCDHMLYVSPSFIRVEADEVTYPLHVIVRYRIEKQLIDGKIEVEHIPELWNSYMKELLGITPPDNRVGCLQDIHWPSGAFGYFPTYTLGAMNAAQLAAKLATEIPQWAELLRKSDLQPIIKWLGRKVHAHGSLFATADELMQNATGETLNPEYFIKHLRSRYLGK